MTGPTTLLGEAGSSNQPWASSQSYPLPAALSPTSGVGRVTAPSAASNTTGQAARRGSQLQDANRSDIPSAQASLVGNGPNRRYALDFQYTADLIHLPADANDNYFQIRNITLGQLPQASGVRPVGGAFRGLLQTGKVSSNSLSDTHPGLFTILLWPFNRCGQHAEQAWRVVALLLQHPAARSAHKTIA